MKGFALQAKTSWLALIAVCFSFLPGAPVWGRSHSFFPLVYSRTDDGDPARSEVFALWPFYSAGNAPDASRKGLHPFWSVGVDHKDGAHGFDVLWPLLSWRERYDAPSKETMRRMTAMPLYFSETSREAGGAERLWRVLFPVFFQGDRRGEPGQPDSSFLVVCPVWWQFNNHRIVFPLYYNAPADSFAVWPFYGRFLNLFSFDSIRFVLWPLWVHSQRAGVDQYSVLWPFFGYATGPGAQGWRVWPLVGFRTSEAQGPRAFWLWPLGNYATFERGTLKGANLNAFFPFWFRLKHPKREIVYYFPVYGHSKSGRRESRAWFWPAYSRTVSRQPIYRKDSILWLLWTRKTGPEVENWQAFILAGWHAEPGKVRANVLWPIGLYLFDRKNAEGYDFVRRYVLPIYYSAERRWFDGHTDGSYTLWPLAAWKRTGERRELTLLKLVPSRESDGVGRNWAPLWTFYNSMRDEEKGVSARRVCGPLFWSSRDERQDRSELNLLFFQYERTGSQKRISFLGGFLPWRIGGAAEE